MILVYHGDNQVKLREEFLRLKGRYDESRFWEKELSELPSYLSSPSFFSTGKKELIAVEDPNLEELGEIQSIKSERDIVLLFPRRLTPRETARLKGAQMVTFWEDVPKNVFPFLDALAAKKRREAISALRGLVQRGADSDYLLKMVGWQLRNLIRVRSRATSGISPYVVKKFEGFIKNWSIGDLKRAVTLLLAEDQRLKKGKKTPLEFLVNKLTQRLGS